MKTNKGNVMILILAAVVVVGVGYWYVTNQPAISKPEPTPTVAPVPTVEEIPELISTVDTSDWIESSYGKSRLFSFKYPPDWKEVLRSGGYDYSPIGGGYILYGRDPNINGDSIDLLSTRVAENSVGKVILNKRFQHEGRLVMVLTTLNYSEPTSKLETRIYIDKIPYLGRPPTSYDGQGVLVLATRYNNPETLDDPYLEVLLNIVSTLKIRDE